MIEAARRIAENLAEVRSRIAAAATRDGRTAGSVRLVGVTKYVGVELAEALVAAGCHDLGESRPQELWAKAEALAGLPAARGARAAAGNEPVRWHLVGHLQRNKIRRTLPLAHLLHSVDSARLLDALDQEAQALGQPAAVLLEANISGEMTKTGLPPDELERIVADAARWPHLSIRGLMGMASLVGGTDTARRDFERLRLLRDRLAPHAPPGVTLGELSMGMSGDFEVAVESGATIVRVGSALFEGVVP